MDDPHHLLFPRFSAELVATALKDTPVVMVTGPRQCGKTMLVRDLVGANANSSAWTTTQFWLQRTAIQQTCRAVPTSGLPAIQEFLRIDSDQPTCLYQSA
jgi:stage III sporulation protein SpoIIIAA